MTENQAKIWALRAFAKNSKLISEYEIENGNPDVDLLANSLDWVSKLLNEMAFKMIGVDYDIPHGSKTAFKSFMKKNPDMLRDFNFLPLSMKKFFFDEWDYRRVSFSEDFKGLVKHMDNTIDLIYKRLPNG